MRRAAWLAIGALTVAVGYALSREDVRSGIGEAVDTLTDKIKNLIAGEEGLRLEAYQDIAGNWTIGYGHLIQPGEQYHPYGPVRAISKAEADALFEADTAHARACVEDAVQVPLTDNQLAALTSFVFNVGCAAFRSSTLLRLLNEHDYAGAAAQLDRWVNAGGVRVAGLVNRRALEKEVFLA